MHTAATITSTLNSRIIGRPKHLYAASVNESQLVIDVSCNYMYMAPNASMDWYINMKVPLSKPFCKMSSGMMTIDPPIIIAMIATTVLKLPVLSIVMMSIIDSTVFILERSSESKSVGEEIIYQIDWNVAIVQRR